jgi:hypothetical protein
MNSGIIHTPPSLLLACHNNKLKNRMYLLSFNKQHLAVIKFVLFFLLFYFRKNGFVLAEDLHALPGNHYLLKAVPFSKNITFGVQGKYLFHMYET